MHPAAARKPHLIVGVAAFAAFLATFNETYLNVAFAPIMSDFGVGVATVQWLATGYMLAAAIMVPVTAFLYRRVPTRRLFVLTVALLVAGSVIGAVAPSFGVLLIGRLVQAIGTGMLIPTGMNITLDVAPRHKLGAYMGVMGAMTTLGPSLGVIVAGALLSVSPWPTLMWVFAAPALLCLVAGVILLTDVATLTRPTLDVTSVALITLALTGILFGVSSLFSGAAGPATLAVVLGVVGLVAFLKRQPTLSEPLLDLRTLAIRPFALGVVLNMIALLVIFALNILIPIYVQSALGRSGLAASMALFPAIFLASAIAPLAGRFYDRRGHRLLLPLGFGLIATFTVLVALAIPSGSLLLVALLYVPVICGSALVIGPVQSFALSRLSHELNPHGVTVMSMGFQVAGCVGSSLFTGVYAFVLRDRANGGADLGDASGRAFLVAAVVAAAFAVVGLVIAVGMRRYAAHPEATLAAPGEVVLDLRAVMETDVYALQPESTALDAL